MVILKKPVQKTCRHCSCKWISKTKGTRICPTCRQKGIKPTFKMRYGKSPEPRECIFCHNQFIPTSPKQIFCTKICRYASYAAEAKKEKPKKSDDSEFRVCRCLKCGEEKRIEKGFFLCNTCRKSNAHMPDDIHYTCHLKGYERYGEEA
jgi:hypothetical protein